CQQAGYRTVSALSLAQVAPLAAGEAPQVILSDLTLPDAPQGDPISALRAMPGLSHTPIILISGKPQAELDALAAARGCQGALSKDAGLPGMMTQLPVLLQKISAG